MFNLGLFKELMHKNGMSGREISEGLNINESTFYRKVNRDGDFSRAEINKLIEILSIEDPEAVFFADELA